MIKPTIARSTGTHNQSRLRAQGLRLAYHEREILHGLDMSLPDGAFTVIVGPNACGKSTLLRALARLLKPSAGDVHLDTQAIWDIPARTVARTLGLLPQSARAPEGIRVADLVARGRYPHQSLFQQWSPADEEVVASAMKATQIEDLADRLVDKLSGGQRQRVWLAMALAQQTPILLLDEPTTYLDIAHQIETLDLCRKLNRDQNVTVLAVLHDLNLAFRYATHLIAMRDGRIFAQGAPSDIVTPGLIENIFGLACQVVPDPETRTPMVVPRAHWNP